MPKAVATLLLSAVAWCLFTTAHADVVSNLENPGFESMPAGAKLPEAWQADIGGKADAAVAADDTVYHSGARSLRISNNTPIKAFVFASCVSRPMRVEPSTTYLLHYYAKGQSAKSCFASVAFENDGDRRQYLPAGDFDWRKFACRFTTPEKCRSVTIRFASDDVTQSFWVDDVSIERAAEQWADLREKRYPKNFDGVWPRSKGPLPPHLLVFDLRNESDEVGRLVTVLQGIVNRTQPRLYLINKTNPPDYDAMWLRYLQEKKYTDQEERIANLPDLLERFRADISGVVVLDPGLPASINAACMIAGVKNALPISPEIAAKLDLPIVEDLRGKWTRNVDAYRYVYTAYWPAMSHHVLAWMHPSSPGVSPRDYMAEFNVFCFWQSGYADNEPGADPEAEEEFINELFANTPANIPVMGWPAFGDNKGIPEYTGVRWASEFGKFVPGTEFCSNLSVHSAIRPEGVFRQPSRYAPHVAFDPAKVYVSCNILDSGDALWYWQFHQQKIWADPARGSVPIGWCMNVTLLDMMPAVLEWYYENATANDTFFAAVSGLGYMNTQVYASRFRPRDRARIWRKYVEETAQYCRKLDIDGIELYNGSWGEPTPPPKLLQRFAHGIEGLDYVLADLGRHDAIRAGNANLLHGKTAIFHTLTRFQVWSSSAEVGSKDMDDSNKWLMDEITRNAPNNRPGFMSAMAISWYYHPAWIADLQQKLPSDYTLVAPQELSRLYREFRKRHLSR